MYEAERYAKARIEDLTREIVSRLPPSTLADLRDDLQADLAAARNPGPEDLLVFIGRVDAQLKTLVGDDA